MPVITMTMAWHQVDTLPSGKAGWDFEISGRGDCINMSSYNFLWTGGPPYRQESGKMVGTGPSVWWLTADEEPALGLNNGAKREKPPMAFAARFLEALESKNYHVVASHSTVMGEGLWQTCVSHIWTLKYAPRVVILPDFKFQKNCSHYTSNGYQLV